MVPGFPFEYQITALNSPVSYSASPLPDGLTLNSATGLISGAIFTAGTYPITLSGTPTTEAPASNSHSQLRFDTSNWLILK